MFFNKYLYVNNNIISYYNYKTVKLLLFSIFGFNKHFYNIFFFRTEGSGIYNIKDYVYQNSINRFLLTHLVFILVPSNLEYFSQYKFNLIFLFLIKNKYGLALHLNKLKRQRTRSKSYNSKIKTTEARLLNFFH